ncbi:MAG: hypothetical protein FJW39_32210 [Acidobacteria bacterium]|nr:hypothetical protein [Acidobacteriota bacterium]
MSRGGGKSTRLELVTGALHVAEVEHAYVSLLHERLPDGVLSELDSAPMTQDAVASWAARHGINAECVRNGFAVYCNGGWTRYGRCNGATWASPATPQDWRVRVAELDAAGVVGDALYGRADERLVDESTRNHDGRFSFPGIESSMVHEALIRHARPISADPSTEPLEAFIVRATRHWRARAKVAAGYGLSPSTSPAAWGNLTRDLEWLYWRDVDRLTVRQIVARWASERHDHVIPETVKKAIRQLSQLLGLPARQSGRPPKQK